MNTVPVLSAASVKSVSSSSLKICNFDQSPIRGTITGAENFRLFRLDNGAVVTKNSVSVAFTGVEVVVNVGSVTSSADDETEVDWENGRLDRTRNDRPDGAFVTACCRCSAGAGVIRGTNVLRRVLLGDETASPDDMVDSVLAVPIGSLVLLDCNKLSRFLEKLSNSLNC
jgi:hypothetical protein